VELKTRDYGIDWLKAFAIVLMVLGHAIQYSLVSNFDSNIIFRLIYSFHMPLFIFVSGYLISPGKNISFLWKQFKLLIIPFLLWMVLYSFYYRRMDLHNGNWAILSTYYLQVFKFPGKGGLWFLWALYVIDVFYFFLRKSRYFYLLSVAMVVLLHVFTPFFPSLNYYGLGLFKVYYPCFLLGCLLRQYRFADTMKNWVVAILLVFMVILQFAWTRTGSVYEFGMPITHDTNSIYALVVRILTPVPVLLLLFRMSRYFKQSNAVVQWLSANTLSIYASHFMWVYLFVYLLSTTILERSDVEICIVFVVALALTWVTVTGINRVPIVRKLLFGR
jgi:fucose 4-O-acetylase-like acetyltransferase